VGRWDLPIFLRAYALLLCAFGAAENTITPASRRPSGRYTWVKFATPRPSRGPRTTSGGSPALRRPVSRL